MAEIKHIQSSKARQSEVIIKELVNVLTLGCSRSSGKNWHLDNYYMWMKWVWHRKSKWLK